MSIQYTRAPSTTGIFPLVNASDANIVLRSSDGVLFKVHRKNLAVHSDVFAAAETISQPVAEEVEVVQLSETSSVLDLLLQFMNRQSQPDLRNVPFEILADLSNTVDKYEVFSAMTKCEMAMRSIHCV